jgi:hypothetical protein
MSAAPATKEAAPHVVTNFLDSTPAKYKLVKSPMIPTTCFVNTSKGVKLSFKLEDVLTPFPVSEAFVKGRGPKSLLLIISEEQTKVMDKWQELVNELASSSQEIAKSCYQQYAGQTQVNVKLRGTKYLNGKSEADLIGGIRCNVVVNALIWHMRGDCGISFGANEIEIL